MPNNFPFNKKSFTLVEILVVVSILAVLAAATMPSLIGYASERSVSRVAQLVFSDLSLVRNKSLSGALDVDNRGDWAFRVHCASPNYDFGVKGGATFLLLESKQLPSLFTFNWVCAAGQSKVLYFKRLTGELINGAGTPVNSEAFRLYYRQGIPGAEKSIGFTIYKNGKINVE